MSAHFQISDLADILHGRSCSWRGMALLRAFFDESGIHGSAKVTGVAGFIGPADEWSGLEEEWESELNRFSADTGHNLSVFHAYECVNGEDYWFGIDRSIREAYYQRLATVICKYKKLIGISVAIELPHWEALASPEFKQRYQSPYGLCAEHCFQHISAIENQSARGEGIALVFAEHPYHSRNIKEVFETYMQTKIWSNVKSLTFSSPKDCRPLQCADMMSYEAFRYWSAIQLGGLQNMKDRPAWKILADNDHFSTSRCYGGLGLITAVRRYHSREGLGEPYPSV